MDLSTIVSWIQAVIWICVGIGYLKKLKRGEAQMPKVSSNKALGVAILIGLCFSTYSLYLNYQRLPHFETPDAVPLKSLELIENRSFTNATIEIDGKNFEHCNFTNVSFVFRGRKTAAIRYNNFQG